MPHCEHCGLPYDKPKDDHFIEGYYPEDFDGWSCDSLSMLMHQYPDLFPGGFSALREGRGMTRLQLINTLEECWRIYYSPLVHQDINPLRILGFKIALLKHDQTKDKMPGRIKDHLDFLNDHVYPVFPLIQPVIEKIMENW